MQRLSEQSLLNALGESGQKTDTRPTHQLGSTNSAGLTSVRAKLMAQSPKETDANLNQWLKSSLNVEPREKVRMTYPVTGGYKREVTGYSFHGLTSENRHKALEAVSLAMTPLDDGKCEQLVGMLYSVTAHRTDAEVSMNIILTMYSQCLARYPADVAQSVINYFCHREEHPNFFPTLSELKSRLDKESTTRRAMFEALNA